MKFATAVALASSALVASTASAVDFPVSYSEYRTAIADAIWEQENAIGLLILGGTEAPRGQRTWISGMRSSAAGTSFCGGSLIAPKWVLTAAHCASSISYVRVGTHLLSGSSDGQGVRVLRKIQHPQFRGVQSGWDYLLLELETAVTAYAPVALAKADASDEPVGKVATTLGWGTTSSGGSQSSVLRQVDVPIISNANCKAKLSSITDTMICAGGERNKDSCQGDSGGPLIVKNGNNTDVLVGVVSWGQGCGQLGFPGVYARVSAGRAFIDQYVKTVRWV